MESARERMTHWAETARKNAGMIVGLGVLTVIAGAMSLAWPWASGMGVAMMVGVALMVGGVARLIAAFHAGSFGRGSLAFLGGALTLVAGVMLFARPGFGLATLTLLLGGYLMADGIFGALLAFEVRPESGWGWMLFSAVTSGLLGFLLLKEWPLSGFFAIGTLIGINLLFSGFSWIAIGSAARKLLAKPD